MTTDVSKLAAVVSEEHRAGNVVRADAAVRREGVCGSPNPQAAAAIKRIRYSGTVDSVQKVGVCRFAGGREFPVQRGLQAVNITDDVVVAVIRYCCGDADVRRAVKASGARDIASE